MNIYEFTARAVCLQGLWWRLSGSPPSINIYLQIRERDITEAEHTQVDHARSVRSQEFSGSDSSEICYIRCGEAQGQTHKTFQSL